MTFGLIVLLIVIASIFAVLHAVCLIADFADRPKEETLLPLHLFLGAFALVVTLLVSYQIGFKRGEIAGKTLTNDHYVLVERKDGSKNWEPKDKDWEKKKETK
jgi:hypothetical protein